MRPKTKLDLRIEELVLHGFSQGDCSRIAASLEQELAVLFLERGMPRSFTRARNISQLDGGSFSLPQNSRAETVGSQLAQTVYDALQSSAEPHGAARRQP
jgi:hypothetical protein